MNILRIIFPLIIVAVIITVFEIFKPKSKSNYSYSRKEFLSPTELAFFQTLIQIINGKYFISTQVQLARIINVQKGTNDEKIYFNKIIQKSVDFVLLDKNTMEVKLVIELDDYTHKRYDRNQRDNFVDNALKSANIPIVHIPVSDNYKPEELNTLISQAISQ
jgi:hypothetical protein